MNYLGSVYRLERDLTMRMNGLAELSRVGKLESQINFILFLNKVFLDWALFRKGTSRQLSEISQNSSEFLISPLFLISARMRQ